MKRAGCTESLLRNEEQKQKWNWLNYCLYPTPVELEAVKPQTREHFSFFFQDEDS